MKVKNGKYWRRIFCVALAASMVFGSPAMMQPSVAYAEERGGWAEENLPEAGETEELVAADGSSDTEEPAASEEPSVSDNSVTAKDPAVTEDSGQERELMQEFVLDNNTGIVAKSYPTLPEGYEISQQFTYDTDGNSTTAYDGKSKKQTLAGTQSEKRYSFFQEGDGIKYDGSGFSFWYQSDAECILEMKNYDGSPLIWLYLDAAPDGRWVTYYYQGNIFYNNDVTKKVRYKSDMKPDIRSKINPEKKCNISFYKGTGDYYVDEVFTFKAVKTAADTYENEEQAFKFSCARCNYQQNTSADYTETGDENGSVELYPTPGLKTNTIDIIYNMSREDKLQFKKAVEKAQQGSGYLQITCEDLLCRQGEKDKFAQICLTIMHTDKKINERTGLSEYVDKKLAKWMIGSGSSETFLIDVKNIKNFEELSKIRVQINASGADADKVKFRLSPVTVYHYPEDEIIVDTDWLKEHTTQGGKKLPAESALVYDEGNDTNRQFLHVPNKRGSVTEIELPDIPVGEYEVYAQMRVNTTPALYTFAINNRIQNMDEHFQFWIKNDNGKYSDHMQIKKIPFGKIKLTKDPQDGSTKLKFLPFSGSGALSENTEMFISYLSFKKTETSVEAETSNNFIVKEYPEPENYEKLRVLNNFNSFVRSNDNRYNKDLQVYGYAGDKNAFNLNSRKDVGKDGIEAENDLLWSDAQNGLDGSALRFWFKIVLGGQTEKKSSLYFIKMNGNEKNKLYFIDFKISKLGENYLYTVVYNGKTIDSGVYDAENGAWATVYYNKIVENGDLSGINAIGIKTPNGTACYVDELHTIQQKAGDIIYEKNADEKTASVAGYNLRIEDIEIQDSYENVPVTTIKENALSKTLTLKSVKLPSSVRGIGANAFAGDRNITTINLDNGVNTIGGSAFKGCTKLGEIAFSAEVTSIADNAFEGCKNLIMAVPYDSYAYQYAVANQMNYRSKQGDFDFYKIGEEIHIAGYTGTKTDVKIPDTIEGLPVTRILADAFAQTSIKTVSSATVTTIGKEAFCECPNLETAVFTNLDSVDEKAFYDCGALNNVNLGKKITKIGKCAFEGDQSLSRIELPETLTAIAQSAFLRCSGALTAEVVRDSYAYKFVNTRETALLQIPDTESDYKYSLWMYEATIIGYDGTDSRLEIPETVDDYTVVAVGEDAFKNNTQITYAAFPDNCKKVMDSAFNGCSMLSNLDINAVLQLGHATFRNCPVLKKVTLTNVTKYWNDTFDSGVEINVNTSQFHRTAVELTNSWHAGINLGCKFDIDGYKAYGTYTAEQTRNLCSDVTQKYIKLLSDSGFDVVRFPITWTAFVNDADNYKVDEAYLDRIQEIVDWIIAEDMYVIINTHHDSSEYNLDYGWLNLYNYSPETCKKYERIWEQVCERFKDYDEHLIFESINEARYADEWDAKTLGANDRLNDLQQRFYNVVRSSGGNNDKRYLMLETYAAAIKDAQCTAFLDDWKSTFQRDPHLMATVHAYNNNIGEENFDYLMARCKKYFTDNGIACVMGESAVQVHSSLSDIKDNKQREAEVIDIAHYEQTGELKYVKQTIKARDYDDWYVSTWLDKYLNVSDRYGIRLIYWEDSGSMMLGAKGNNPCWYFPSAIDVFMNHAYHITVDGERVTLKNLSFMLPENQEILYYTNGKNRFEPGVEVKLSQVKDKTEIVSVRQGDVTDPEEPADPEEPTGPEKPTDPKEPSDSENPAETEPTVSDMEKVMDGLETDEAPEGSLYNLLKVRLAKTTKNSIKLKWDKVSGATGYIIYGNLCGKGNKYERLETIGDGSKVNHTFKKLKKGKYYKFLVMAVKEYDGTQKVIAVSKSVHIAVQGGKAGNYKKVTLTNVKKQKVTIKEGKSFTVKAKSVVQNGKLKVKKHRGLCYESTNPEIAKVNKKGKITAVKKGQCYIYVYDQSGNYSRIKVTVR